jgi:hypothetical protein
MSGLAMPPEDERDWIQRSLAELAIPLFYLLSGKDVHAGMASVLWRGERLFLVTAAHVITDAQSDGCEPEELEYPAQPTGTFRKLGNVMFRPGDTDVAVLEVKDFGSKLSLRTRRSLDRFSAGEPRPDEGYFFVCGTPKVRMTPSHGRVGGALVCLCPSAEQSGRFEAAVNGGFGASGFAV